MRSARVHHKFGLASVMYDCLGWVTIPIRNDSQGHKKAACAWKEYQTRRPTPGEVKRMFSRRDLTGLAAVLRDGLYMRDFDLVEAYQRWSEAYPTLARALPTFRTGRGFQVCAYSPTPVKTVDLGDGELRGQGGYSVLPPSIHPTGVKYAWVIGGPDVRVDIAPDKAGLSRPWCPKTEEQREQRGQRLQMVSEVSDVVR